MRIVLCCIVFVVGIALCGCDTPCYGGLHSMNELGGASCPNANVSVVAIGGSNYVLCTCDKTPVLDAGASHD